MSGEFGRKQMALDIVAILQASIKTKLATLPNSAIEYGTRTFAQLFSVQFTQGIFISFLSGPSSPLTLSAAKQDGQISFQIIIFKVGHDPKTDQQWLLDIAEEIEAELYADVNMTLTNGGNFMGVPTFQQGPPVGRGEMTLHFILMEVLYEKTGAM